MWLLYTLFGIALFNKFTLVSSTKHYCQPEEECWPTSEEVEEFKKYLTPKHDDCYGFPTFSSVDEPGT